MKTDSERIVELMHRLRPGDVVEYEGTGEGREGSVRICVSEVAEQDGIYCIFAEGVQGGEYALFPEGRPNSQKFNPPEACFIDESGDGSLSNMELLTHGTVERMYVIADSDVIDNFRHS